MKRSNVLVSTLLLISVSVCAMDSSIEPTEVIAQGSPEIGQNIIESSIPAIVEAQKTARGIGTHFGSIWGWTRDKAVTGWQKLPHVRARAGAVLAWSKGKVANVWHSIPSRQDIKTACALRNIKDKIYNFPVHAKAYIKANPFRAVGIAAVTAVVLYTAWRLLRSRRTEKDRLIEELKQEQRRRGLIPTN